jgi:flagellar motility protein MotE (MotC chaperone)
MHTALLKTGLVASLMFCLAFGLAYAAEQKPIMITSADVQKAIALKEREESLAAKEKEIQEREQVLAAVQKEVDEKLANLLALQKQVQGYIDEFKTTQSAEFKNMVKIYSALSASKVVTLFEKMEEDEIVRIMRAMKFDQIVKIIPKFPPAQAVSIANRLGMVEKEVSP